VSNDQREALSNLVAVIDDFLEEAMPRGQREFVQGPTYQAEVEFTWTVYSQRLRLLLRVLDEARRADDDG
jgi:hypothetical protein